MSEVLLFWHIALSIADVATGKGTRMGVMPLLIIAYGMALIGTSWTFRTIKKAKEIAKSLVLSRKLLIRPAIPLASTF